MECRGRIGVIIPQVSSNIDTQFIDAVHRKAAEFGYDTIVLSGVINYVDDHVEAVYSRGQTNIYDLIIHGDFSGFVFEADTFCSEKLRRSVFSLLSRSGRPCVTVNPGRPGFPAVSADESVPLYLAAMHLIKEHGCRKLYCIGGNKGHKSSEERIDGFRKAMDEAGLPWDEDCIFYGNYWKEVPRTIAGEIAEGKLARPDGVVCGSDIMAAELCRALMELGVDVPGDIAVTGCDGSIISQTGKVSITTAAGQERINGVLAVTKLLEMLGESAECGEMLPELITGESCGCGGKGVFCGGSDIREYAGAMFALAEHRKTNSHGEMFRRMNESKDIYDVLGTFMGCVYMIPTAVGAELCLCDNWCRDLDDPSVYRRGGLSDTMLLGTDCSAGSETMVSFPAGDIFPSLKKPHEPRLIMVTSLHYKGQIFGYVGLTYEKAINIVLDDFYMSWCDTISSGLNTVQNRMYKEYVNKRIESLSEFAPVLGIYNRRGLINKLMNLMSENSGTVMLAVLSYIKEERVHYSVPPVNSIVNAIRISDDRAVLASLGDEMIAAVFSGKAVTEEELACEVAERVISSYKGTVEIKQERIAAVSCAVSQADIFRIESLINDMEDRLRGRMISRSSGAFSYRERFNALRSDIMRYPERNWNIDSITRSMGLSKTHFHRIYREFFGSGCKEDIIGARLEKVKWMLVNTALSVAQISEQCGYSSSSHLIRQFTERVGVSPSAFRKRNGTKSQ